MRPRPRWGRLYALTLPADAAFALVGSRVTEPSLRVPLACTLVALTWGAIGAWVRANRVALDLVEWCPCASRTLTVRVIVSESPRAARPESAEAIAVFVDDGATLPM